MANKLNLENTETSVWKVMFEFDHDPKGRCMWYCRCKYCNSQTNISATDLKQKGGVTCPMCHSIPIEVAKWNKKARDKRNKNAND